MQHFIGILGMMTVMGLAYAFSTNRQAIRYKTVAWGLGLQIAFAFLVMRSEYGRSCFSRSWEQPPTGSWIFAYYGTAFVFGDLGEKNSPRGFYFAFQALPTIIFIAALFAVLYYLGVMQVIVKAAARCDDESNGREAEAESLNVAASIVMGQTEAPVTIRPFSAGRDAVGNDDHYDQRNGARIRGA